MDFSVEGVPTTRCSTKSWSQRIGMIAVVVAIVGVANALSAPSASAAPVRGHQAVAGTSSAVAGTSFAAPFLAAMRRGGIDMNAACSRQYPGSSAVLLEQNAFGWRCYGSAVIRVDMNQACRDQYDNGSAFASYNNDFESPYSWACYA
jgi:hypothetical protein